MIKILLFASLIGCTDAEISDFKSLNKESHIICFSGGKSFYEGYSTGTIIQSTNRWYFKEKSTHTAITISGDCIIKVKIND